ncbi:hypothetical protein JX265_005172 [Neoarthrinium moseri]|uniref:Uncharacterized protein n=1 Tax=Neoarthrinium moseri TaxID=1658444 RepID=A0A9Q0AQV5_9PEZI|nr:hypothetical protein JX266_010737 [Neoarthrinium moseri]KAI1873550.1 hypothetical protein JX265_005172 [Neoarthrinium moseri]
MDIVSFALDAQASYNSDKPLYIDAADSSVSLSATQTECLVKQLIAGFRAAGLRKGDPVLVCMPNNCFYIALILGIVGAGGVFCGTNPAYQLDELVHIANIARPRLIIASPGAIPTIAQMCEIKGIPNECVFAFDDLSMQSEHLDHPAKADDTLASEKDASSGTNFVSDLRKHGESPWETLPDEEAARNTPAIYFPTSGTTGLPKLASLSHYSLIAQHRSLFTKTPYEVARLACLPLFHIFGVAWALFSPLRYGEPLYIMARFSLDDYISNIHKYAISETYMAPPMVHAMNRSDRPLRQLMSTIQYIGIGGAPIDATAMRQMRSYLQPGATVTPVWGMTEFGPAVLFRWGEHDDTGSIGRLMEDYEMKLVDDFGRQVVKDNQPGELLIRSKAIMTGYLGIPMCNEDGWFPTGDIAQVHEDKLYIVGRSKELIKVKGWQVAPAELEAVIIQHPNVVDCAVVGVLSEDKVTEAPRAYVVQRHPGRESVLGQEIYDLVRSRLVSYKKLAGGVVFVESIPRTPSGKVQRFKLLERTGLQMDDGRWPSLYKSVRKSIAKLRRNLSTAVSAAKKNLGGPATTAWLLSLQRKRID